MIGMGKRKFALVHDYMAVFGGAEGTLKEICGLFEGPLFTAQYNPDKFPWLKGREVVTSWVQKMPMALTRHYIYAPIMPWVYRAFNLRPYDVILTDSHSFAHQVRKRPGALHVCYYYTPARSLWAPEIDNRALGGRFGALRKVLAKKLKALDLEASKGPDVLMAISHTIGERVEMAYGRKVDHVIYPPVETQKWSDVQPVDSDQGFLMWGRLIAYKKYDLAIEACKITGHKLQIVGSGPFEPELRKLAEGMPNVTFHGRLSDADLKSLMSHCKGVLFPCYEDFGIVPVEGMAAGLPVVAYGVGGAGETVTPDCGVLFDEQTPECLAEAMRKLDSRTFDSAVLKANAARFDVEIFRQQYKEAVESAMAKHFGEKA